MIGEYQHNLDAKGRLFMPSRLREGLGDVFYICKGLGGCLFAFSEENWSEFEARVNTLPLTRSIKMRRIVFSSAYKCGPDQQGRILLSQKLRDYANIQKGITVVGIGAHVEIWASERWEAVSNEFKEAVLASVMDELGF